MVHDTNYSWLVNASWMSHAVFLSSLLGRACWCSGGNAFGNIQSSNCSGVFPINLTACPAETVLGWSEDGWHTGFHQWQKGWRGIAVPCRIVWSSDHLMHKLHCETSGLCRTSSRRSSQKVFASAVASFMIFLFPVSEPWVQGFHACAGWGCQAACWGSMVLSLWFSLASLASGTQSSDSATRTTATVFVRFWL